LESGVDEKWGRLTVSRESGAEQVDWDEVRFKIECYLRAWRFREDDAFRELVRSILSSAQSRVAENPHINPARIAIEETDQFLEAWWKRTLAQSIEAPDDINWTRQQVALLLAYLPTKSQREFLSADPDLSAYRQASIKLRLARQPQRPAESCPDRMRTSLSRLPSFRLIAGWFLFAVLLFLTFIFTH